MGEHMVPTTQRSTLHTLPGAQSCEPWQGSRGTHRLLVQVSSAAQPAAPVHSGMASHTLPAQRLPAGQPVPHAVGVQVPATHALPGAHVNDVLHVVDGWQSPPCVQRSPAGHSKSFWHNVEMRQ